VTLAPDADRCKSSFWVSPPISATARRLPPDFSKIISLSIGVIPFINKKAAIFLLKIGFGQLVIYVFYFRQPTIRIIVNTMPRTRQKAYALTKDQISAGISRNFSGSTKKRKNAPAQTRNNSAKQKKAPAIPRTPPATPPIDLTGRQGRRVTRKDKPRCSDFGVNRRILYPGARFCSNCDYLQEHILSGQYGQINPNGLRFKCLIEHSSQPHTSFVFPSPYDKENAPPTFLCKPVNSPVDCYYSNSSDECSTTENEFDATGDESSLGSAYDGRTVETDEEMSDVEDPMPGLTTPLVETILHDDDEKGVLSSSPVLPTVHNNNPVLEQSEQTPTNLESSASPNSSPNSVDSEDGKPPAAITAPSPCADTMSEIEKQLKEIIRKKEEEILFLKGELNTIIPAFKVARRRISRMYKAQGASTHQRQTTNTSSVDCADYVRQHLLRQLGSTERSGDQIMDLFYKELLKKQDNLPEEASSAIRQSTTKAGRKILRTDVYSKGDCLRTIDMTAVGTNLQTFDDLRKMETAGKKYSHEAVLPSGSTLQNGQTVVEAFARKKITTKQGLLRGGGEFFEFAPDEILACMIDAFGLTEEAKRRPIRISLSIDGAQISKRIVHVTMGFKVNDPSAVCPFTGRPLFLSSDDQLMQSRNICIPVLIVLKRETKDVYKHFWDTYKFFREMSTGWDVVKDGPIRDNELTRRAFKPVKLALNMDMSATWKLFGIGGAAKVKQHPCHCCAIRSKDLSTPNATPCNKWCRELHSDDPDWECYHHEFLDTATLQRMREDLEQVKEKLGSLADKVVEISEQSSFDCTEDPRVVQGNSTADITSIHFDYTAEGVTEADKLQYSVLLNAELIKRNISALGSMAVRRQRLKDSLVSEWQYLQLKKGLAQGELMENSACAFLVIDAVPCSLHMENRIGLKFLTLLLTEGLSNAMDKKLYMTEFPRSEAKRRRKLLQDVNRHMNKTILGSRSSPAQWECPTEGDNKEIGTICMDNNRTRKVVTKLGGLIDICIPEGDVRRQQWKEAVLDNYVPAFEILRRKEDLSEAQIAEFQLHIDKWFQVWNGKLWGLEGNTNYIHLLASGHISEYLRYWKSLYPHSQQGWESLNSMLKVFYFKRTARGGQGGGKWANGRKSRILPIARWLLRRTMWASGFSFDEMAAFMKAHPAEEQDGGMDGEVRDDGTGDDDQDQDDDEDGDDVAEEADNDRDEL
jgi:hypothetical protein